MPPLQNEHFSLLREGNQETQKVHRKRWQRKSNRSRLFSSASFFQTFACERSGPQLPLPLSIASRDTERDCSGRKVHKPHSVIPTHFGWKFEHSLHPVLRRCYFIQRRGRFQRKLKISSFSPQALRWPFMELIDFGRFSGARSRIEVVRCDPSSSSSNDRSQFDKTQSDPVSRLRDREVKRLTTASSNKNVSIPEERPPPPTQGVSRSCDPLEPREVVSQSLGHLAPPSKSTLEHIRSILSTPL